MAGVSRAAVSAAISRGKLRKPIDTNDELTRLYLKLVPARRMSPGGKKKGKEEQNASPSHGGKKKKGIPDVSIPAGPPRSEKSGETLEEANRRKTIETADKLQLANQEKRRELIHSSLLHSFLAKLYTIDTAQFLTRGDRIAAEVAGAARSAASDEEATIRVNDRLTEDAYQEQAHKKQLMRDFLKRMKIPDDITVEG